MTELDVADLRLARKGDRDAAERLVERFGGETLAVI